MTSMLGNLILAAATLLAAAGMIAALRAATGGDGDSAGSKGTASGGGARQARWFISGYLAAMTLASLVLWRALLASDFHIQYVGDYTERALPVGYKLAAFWAGQEGSLLLWGWMLGMVAALAAWLWRQSVDARVYPWALAILALCATFFGALVLFAANPFDPARQLMMDGHGLNPLLQDPGMIAHPPLLFAGYAGFAAPFALLIGNLAVGPRGNDWVKPMRRWLLASWIFLGVGILLGANWAYTQLGWGGYWAWDPVENASLLPWLTSTALLHSLVMQERRGLFGRWNAGLTAASFILCLTATYITRSGIQSVHTFEASHIGTFFLVFLSLCTLLSAGLILRRLPALTPSHGIDSYFGREAVFLVINLLLSAITLVVLVGTIFPLLSSFVSGSAVEVKPDFYNARVAPAAMVVVALMAFGPLLGTGPQAGRELLKHLLIPGVLALAATGVIVALWPVRGMWSIATAAIISLTACAVGCELIRSVILLQREQGGSPLVILIRLLDSSHRRFGAQIAHLGLALLVGGVVGSSLFEQKEFLTLAPGQENHVADIHLALNRLGNVRGPNYTATQADLTLTEATGKQTQLQPQIRVYDKQQQSNTIVALRSDLRRDLYVTLAGADASQATFQVIINPLVNWIWLGGLLLTLGGIYGMLPMLLRPAAAPAAAPVTPAVKERSSKDQGRSSATRASGKPSRT